jgi:hypothetical protein
VVAVLQAAIRPIPGEKHIISARFQSKTLVLDQIPLPRDTEGAGIETVSLLRLADGGVEELEVEI